MLALFFYRPTYSISGIMVANFHRINKQGLKNRINYLRKKIQTWLITKNGKIQTIFILNDDEAVNYFNQCYRCCLFKMLPDPIPQIKSSNNFDVRTSYNIDINRKIILHIGVLGERKGTLDIITAMKYIPTFLQQNICLCIIGKATEYFNNTLNKLIIDSGIGANVQIVRENSFIDNERMKSYFEQCDCVLIPYKIPELSSGILGHASLAGKPVIGPNKGLLGELIVKNRLGLVFNDLFEFKDKLISVLLGDFIYFKNEKFINSRSPDFFAKMILDSCTTEKI
jgi:glycosyltransferase involved in cell wall biosynthesis